MQHIHVILQMVTSFCDIDWAVLTIYQVLLIKVLQSLLIVFALSHKVKCVVLIIQISCILRDNRDTTHVDGQAKKSALKQ